MNAGKLRRAIDRHLFMKDRPVYREFLQHVKGRGGVWMASQGEIARWWEARQLAALGIEAAEGGSVRVSCSLPGAVAEVDGQKLIPCPFEIGSGARPGTVASPVSLACAPGFRDFAKELIGHLGYGHVRIAGENSPAGTGCREASSLLASLRETASAHWRYDQDLLGEFRKRIADAHRRAGLPDIRIWNMPHSGGIPFTSGLSTRYDVDKAIGLVPSINSLEAGFGLRSTAYLRPMGIFYGRREIERFALAGTGCEIALHGEFVTTSRRRFTDEFEAASLEKRILEEMSGREVIGVCMHGGELRSNVTENTRPAVEKAGFVYETMFRNGYHLPLHLPFGDSVFSTLSIGQHFADVSVPPGRDFSERLLEALTDRFDRAAASGGFFVPVMHPLYFDVLKYFSSPVNLLRMIRFLPAFAGSLARMKKDQEYVNRN